MSIIYCHDCDTFVDSDYYEIGEDENGELICLDCLVEKQIEGKAND